VAYSNLSKARDLAKALRRRFGALRLTIPHLGLHHREPYQKGRQGNGAWFGLDRTECVRVVSDLAIAESRGR
jgi:hypothetical protein